MAIRRVSLEDLGTGRVDLAKVDATTEEDIEQQSLEDDIEALAVDVRSLRERMNLSAPAFAKRFGFPVRTLEQWEQGRRRPSGAALVLLKVIEQDPQAVERAIGHSG